MNGPQTRCKKEAGDRPRWGEERCTEQIEALGERKVQERDRVFRNVPNIQHGRVTPFPSHRLQLRTIRGSGPARGSSSA
jgi:hypothetical protein